MGTLSESMTCAYGPGPSFHFAALHPSADSSSEYCRNCNCNCDVPPCKGGLPLDMLTVFLTLLTDAVAITVL